MLNDVVFISMEGKTNFKIGDFLVREDISLPVYVKEGEKFSIDYITPENVITGMIKVLSDNSENENIDYYRDFIFTVQPDIEARLSHVAYEAEKNHHYDEALEIYRILYFLKPDSIEQNLNIAICYDEFSKYLFSQGRDKEANKFEEQAYHFFKILDGFENKTDRVYYYLGRFYVSHENYEKAVEYFRQFIDITNDIEKKEEVIQLLEDIIDKGVTDEDYQTALELIHADKAIDAIGYIDRFAKKYPKSWNAYYVKGWAFKKMEKYQDAIELFEKALKLNPDSSDIYNELGLCYLSLKVFHKSELNFFRALKKSPDDIAIISNLALCSFKKGNKQEALKYCDVILEFNPKDLDAKNLKKVIEESNI
ncbi:MAG: tetratricopeptide repeat protein [Spirochaetes bacterium]|nr:tetratricopeptide repeat protein [Spirochaetota bacterium]